MKNIVDIAHTTIFNYGTVGKETFLTDSKGNTLYVGDIVELDTRKYSNGGGGIYKTVIVEDDDGPFAMGWKCYQDFDNTADVKIIKGHGGLTLDNEVLKEWDFVIMSEELMKEKIREYVELNNVLDDIKYEISHVSSINELKEVLKKYSTELL